MAEQELQQNFITELRRGSLTMAVLGCLRRPHYGYALLQTMQQAGINIEANTLYPLLRRLEGQGLLTSIWNTTESRPRKYYSVSENGHRMLAVLLAEWEKIHYSMQQICEGDLNEQPD